MLLLQLRDFHIGICTLLLEQFDSSSQLLQLLISALDLVAERPILCNVCNLRLCTFAKLTVGTIGVCQGALIFTSYGGNLVDQPGNFSIFQCQLATAFNVDSLPLKKELLEGLSVVECGLAVSSKLFDLCGTST